MEWRQSMRDRPDFRFHGVAEGDGGGEGAHARLGTDDLRLPAHSAPGDRPSLHGPALHRRQDDGGAGIDATASSAGGSALRTSARQSASQGGHSTCSNGSAAGVQLFAEQPGNGDFEKHRPPARRGRRHRPFTGAQAADVPQRHLEHLWHDGNALAYRPATHQRFAGERLLYAALRRRIVRGRESVSLHQCSRLASWHSANPRPRGTAGRPAFPHLGTLGQRCRLGRREDTDGGSGKIACAGSLCAFPHHPGKGREVRRVRGSAQRGQQHG